MDFTSGSQNTLVADLGIQYFSPVVAGLAGGGYAVLKTKYHSVGVTYDVFVDRYNSNGTLVGTDEVLSAAHIDRAPDIAGLSDGGYVITWQPSEGTVEAHRYDAAGHSLGADIQVNTTSVVSNGNASSGSAVASLLNGGFVVVWQGDGGSAPSTDHHYSYVYAQQFNSAGAAVGAQVQVNSSVIDGFWFTPQVTGTSDGGYVVSWTSGDGSGTAGAGPGISVQRYDAIGSAIGSEIQVVAPDSTHYVNAGEIAGLESGGFIVTWQDLGRDGAGFGVYQAVYSATGSKISEQQVNTFTSFDQYAPTATALADGGYLISWTSNGQDGSGAGIYAQRFDAAGHIIGPETLIEQDAAGDQWHSSVANLTDGSFVVTWINDQDRIAARHYTPITAIAADDNNNALTGTAAGDIIGGAGGDDQIVGLSGNDILSGDRGADVLFGGSGNDILSADRQIGFDNGTDVDHLYGGDGNDFIYSGYGDIVDGGAGFDTVAVSYIGATHGISGDTRDLHQGLSLADGAGSFLNVERFSDIALTSFDDRMVIGDQHDPAVVRSWDGNDYLIGQEVSITMYGGNGNDTLVGSTSDDVLYGENGDDILMGYLGNDQLWGGSGADRFLITHLSATPQIMDFEHGIDRIDLTALDANAAVAGDQAFNFIGSANFSGTAGELRFVGSASTGYHLEGDVNGDHVADFIVGLGSASTVTASDLLL